MGNFTVKLFEDPHLFSFQQSRRSGNGNAGFASWPLMKNLLAPPSSLCLKNQEDVCRAITRAVPVPASRAKDLPYAVRDLSRMLTREREELRTPYWSAPRFLAAYAHFFLPWNIHRLSWLLPELDLPLPDGSRILDLGSGPLTLPLALWCARPDLHDKRLHFICTDTAQSPLDAGKRIFNELGLPAGWRLEFRRKNLDAAVSDSDLNLIMAGNVLNELAPPRHGTEERRLTGLLERMLRSLIPGGRIFLLEPGNRRGGRGISLFRKAGQAAGCTVLAPCTHEGPCPMLEQNRYTPDRPASSGWCHFTHPPRLAPAHIADLSSRAGMEKEGLALSCLLLQTPTTRVSHISADDDLDDLESLYNEALAEDAGESLDYDQPDAPVPAKLGPQDLRVISGLIRLPDHPEPGRYACGPSGLCLLCDAVRVPSGAGVKASPQPDLPRDAKTGALIMRWAGPKPAGDAADKAAPVRPAPSEPADTRKRAPKNGPERRDPTHNRRGPAAGETPMHGAGDSEGRRNSKDTRDGNDKRGSAHRRSDNDRPARNNKRDAEGKRGAEDKRGTDERRGAENKRDAGDKRGAGAKRDSDPERKGSAEQRSTPRRPGTTPKPRREK